MQTEIKGILIYGYYFTFKQDYLDTKLKEIQTLGVDEQYSLDINGFIYGEEKNKKIFEILFVKQKPNLISLRLLNSNLFPNSFKLFTEKRWDKLIHI